jgi:DNA (cytosine-5)-methyltransferase 1
MVLEIILIRIKHLFQDLELRIERLKDLSTPQLPSEQKKLANEFYEITGIIGGPPCQDYSIGGSNKGKNGDRGKLIFSYVSIVKQTQPSFIFFENVSGLLNTKNHQLAFFDFVSKLEKAGYKIWYEILNSLDYGVPQDRPRIALVGFKKSIVRTMIINGYKLVDENNYSDDLVFKWPKKKFINPKSIDWPSQWKFGSEIINNDITKIPNKFLKLTVLNAFDGLTIDSPNQNESFEPYSKKFSKIAEGDTTKKSFKRLHRYRYSPTVAYGNNEVHLHPTEKRRLTVREALRLQSVPDSYILPSESTLTSKFKIISNGVPTSKAALIAKEIKRTLENYRQLGNGYME